MSSSAIRDNVLSKTPRATLAPEGGVFQIALRDIHTLFRTPWIIISRSLAFIIQLFVFATLISKLIPADRFSNFFQYYAVGSVVGTIASISFIIGYDIFEEAEEGVLDYLLTLPVSRRQFIIGRALGGAIRAMIYIIPMFVIISVLERFANPLALAAATLDLFLLAFGITGLSITVAVSVRSANRFDVVLALLELAVSRASTALYPIAFMPVYVAAFAPFSPVSLAADSARAALTNFSLDVVGLAGLVAFVAVFLGLGAAFYFRKLEGGVFA
jgi:ABC-2 type transport system permease protein